jgi:hypothetical protein
MEEVVEGGAAVPLGLLAEPLTDLPVGTADRQDVSPGQAAVEFAAESQNGLGQKMMRGHGRLVFRLDFRKGEGRAEIDGGVDEDDHVVFGAVQGVLDSELVVGVADDTGDLVLLKTLDKDRPGAVIAAAGVADADDQGFPVVQRLFLSMTRPAASWNSISSGIFPRAWVAQLRQGS